MTAATVVLVEDHLLLADALAASLRAEGMTAQLMPLESRESLIEGVAAASPDLVLLDLDLGDPIGDASTLVGPFTQAGAAVLVVTASTCPHQVGTAVEQGALDVLPKTTPFEELLATVVAACRGTHRMSDAERQRVLRELHEARHREEAALAPFLTLTPREAQVLHAMSDGRSVATMAREWFLSEATVRSQVRGVLTKLGVSSQLEAVALARLAGWLH